MAKGTRTKCKGHDGYFIAKPNEGWKFLCKNCYKKYYVPMNKKYSAKELKDNWDVLFAKYKADQEESSAHAWEIVREIFKDSKGDCICPY